MRPSATTSSTSERTNASRWCSRPEAWKVRGLRFHPGAAHVRTITSRHLTTVSVEAVGPRAAAALPKLRKERPFHGLLQSARTLSALRDSAGAWGVGLFHWCVHAEPDRRGGVARPRISGGRGGDMAESAVGRAPVRRSGAVDSRRDSLLSLCQDHLAGGRFDVQTAPP